MKTRNILDLQVHTVPVILLKLSWPVIVSLLAQSLYSFIDGIYLARLGDEVLSAVSLSFTVQKFIMMFFTGLATGMNAVISKAIGAGDNQKARNTMFSGFLTQLTFSAIVTVVSFWFVPAYFRSTAGSQAVCDYGIAYLLPCVAFCVFSASQMVFERLLQSSGLAMHMLVCQIVGSVINVVLDPIMIFGMNMGIAGAAYATITGQAAATLLAVILNFRYNSLLFSDVRSCRFRWNLVGQVCYIGIPSTAVGMAASICAFFINDILISFHPTANAAYGVYAKLENLILVIGQGFSAGMVTLLSFYMGKRDYQKLKSTLWNGEVIVFSWMAICTIAFNVMPKTLLIPFRLSPEMLELTAPALRIVSLTYLSSAIMIGVAAFFQAAGKSIYSLVTALTKQVLVRIPAALWLSTFGNISLIWWCWPLSEILSDIISLIIFARLYSKVRKDLTVQKVT